MDEILDFKFKGRVYMIEFPNVGKYRQIEILKQSISLGQYGNLFRTMTKQSEETLDMIDIESYLSTLCPKLLKDLKIETFGDLSLSDSRSLKKEYQLQFVPWWNNIEKMLKPEDPSKEKEDGKQG